MKKRIKAPISALYAAPSFFAKDEYPDNHRKQAEEDDLNIKTVYAGPEFFKSKEDEALISGVYAGPEPIESEEYPKSLREDGQAAPPVAAPMMMVYAGPDYFSGRKPEGFGLGAAIQDVYAGPEPAEPEEQEEPAEPEEVSEDERMRKLMEKFEKEPPVMQGLVQCDPSVIRPAMGMGMGMGQGAERTAPKFCPECGTKTTPGDKFCRECGNSLL